MVIKSFFYQRILMNALTGLLLKKNKSIGHRGIGEGIGDVHQRIKILKTAGGKHGIDKRERRSQENRWGREDIDIN
jgi:hypothetical protein